MIHASRFRSVGERRSRRERVRQVSSRPDWIAVIDFEPRVRDVAQPLLWIFSQASLEQRTDRRGCVRGYRRPVGLTLQDARQRVGDPFALERPASRQHLEEHAAKRPDVGALVHHLAAGLLRAHVRGCTENPSVFRPVERRRRRSFRIRITRGDCLRDAEVEHLHARVARSGARRPFEHDVGRLQVAVDDAFEVRRIERLDQLTCDRQPIGQRQRTALRGSPPMSAPRRARGPMPIDRQPLPARRWRRCAGDSVWQVRAPRAQGDRAAPDPR